MADSGNRHLYVRDCFPDKSQPHIQGTINQLIAAKKIIRDDSGSVFTIRVPQENEIIPEPRNYSRGCIDKSTDKITMDGGSLPDDVKSAFNSFWSGFFNDNQDYYSKLPLHKLVQLKKIVSKINNLISYNSTLMAALLISDILKLPDNEVTTIESKIKTSSINANGYDIKFTGSTNFICEVKANIPSGGKNLFGGKQGSEIKKDINGLIYGKMKAKLTQQDLTEYYKFMGFYSDGDYSINAVHSIVKSLNREFGGIIELWHGQEDISKEKIYVFMVSDEEQSA